MTTVDLATIGTSTANPGSFYGRKGRGPDVAASAADAAADAAAGLFSVVDSITDSDAMLAICLDPAARIRGSLRHLAACLKLEADMAALALTPDLSVPEPPAAEDTRKNLQAAARHVMTAVPGVLAAWRALDRDLRRDPGAEPAARLRAAAAAESRAADLEDELQNASRRYVAASLPMLTGHAAITTALSLTLSRLRLSCDKLAEAVGALGLRSRGMPGRVTSPLADASSELIRAVSAADRAAHVLESACDIVRTAPPGIPCGDCTGTCRSRLTGSTCARCRGGGTDPYAGRPIT
jgi:hypothetical protein